VTSWLMILMMKIINNARSVGNNNHNNNNNADFNFPFQSHICLVDDGD